MLVLTIVLACGVAWLGSKLIVPPIVRLCATIESIDQNSNLTIRSDNDSRDEIGKISTSLNAMLDKFSGIITSANTATEQQSTVTEQVNQRILDISQVADTTSEGAAQTADSAMELAQLANNLQALVGQFKV